MKHNRIFCSVKFLFLTEERQKRRGKIKKKGKTEEKEEKKNKTEKMGRKKIRQVWFTVRAGFGCEWHLSFLCFKLDFQSLFMNIFKKIHCHFIRFCHH